MTDTLAHEIQFSDLVARFIKESKSCRCPVTQLLVTGDPKSNEWKKPTVLNGEIVSWIGRVIINSGITADELTNAVDYLRQKEK